MPRAVLPTISCTRNVLAGWKRPQLVGDHPYAKARQDGSGTYQVRHGDWRAIYEETPTMTSRLSLSAIEGTSTDERNQQPAPPDEMVTLRPDEYEALLDQIDEAEDRAATLQHRMDRKGGRGDLWLTGEEVDRLLDGASPVTIWREKRGMSLRGLAAAADISPSLLSEIEGGTKTGSVDTLRKLSHALKVDLDTLVP